MRRAYEEPIVTKPARGMLIDMSQAIKVDRNHPASEHNPGLSVSKLEEGRVYHSDVAQGDENFCCGTYSPKCQGNTFRYL